MPLNNDPVALSVEGDPFFSSLNLSTAGTILFEELLNEIRVSFKNIVFNTERSVITGGVVNKSEIGSSTERDFKLSSYSPRGSVIQTQERSISMQGRLLVYDKLITMPSHARITD